MLPPSSASFHPSQHLRPPHVEGGSEEAHSEDPCDQSVHCLALLSSAARNVASALPPSAPSRNSMNSRGASMVHGQARRVGGLFFSPPSTFLALAGAAKPHLQAHPSPWWSRWGQRLWQELAAGQEDPGCLLQPAWALLYAPACLWPKRCCAGVGIPFGFVPWFFLVLLSSPPSSVNPSQLCVFSSNLLSLWISACKISACKIPRYYTCSFLSLSFHPWIKIPLESAIFLIFIFRVTHLSIPKSIATSWLSIQIAFSSDSIYASE